MGILTFGCLLAAFLLMPAPGAAQPAEGSSSHRARTVATSRRAIASLEGRLEQAVAEASPPHAGILLGRASGSRGYRLPGCGVVFVLSPRALPGREGAVYVVRRGVSEGAHGHGEEGGEPHRDLEIVTATAVEEIEALERQVLILQHAAAAQRRAAEEDHERIVRDIRIRLGPAPHREVHAGEPPAILVDETAPLPEGPDVTALPEGGPGPPPWRFWFGEEVSEEGRTPDGIVDDVRGAVIGVLEDRAPGIAGLGPDEFVTVAVDFVPGGFFVSHRRPTRTLIVRARQKDLEAHARGKIASKELRARVEVFEY
jgi:hypothetical protein